MLFISIDDFLSKAKAISPHTKEKEKVLAERMRKGDAAARDELVRGYLPFVAGFLRRVPASIQSMDTVYACIWMLEKSVDQFDFSRDQRFVSYLGRALRQCITRSLANRP